MKLITFTLSTNQQEIVFSKKQIAGFYQYDEDTVKIILNSGNEYPVKETAEYIRENIK